MKAKIIDPYGIPATSYDYFKREKMAADIVSGTDGKTYMRFSMDEVGPIWQIDQENGTAIRWAYGKWSMRETLVYDTDVNSPLQINTET